MNPHSEDGAAGIGLTSRLKEPKIKHAKRTDKI
jgi:hypothetical protein